MERNRIETVRMSVVSNNESGIIGRLLEQAGTIGVSSEDAKRIKRFLRAHPDSPHTLGALGQWIYRPIDGFINGKIWKWFIWPIGDRGYPQHWGDAMDRIGDYSGN